MSLLLFFMYDIVVSNVCRCHFQVFFILSPQINYVFSQVVHLEASIFKRNFMKNIYIFLNKV